jgi:hypothetical protein
MARTPFKRNTSTALLASTASLTIAIAAVATIAPIDNFKPTVATAQAQAISISVQFRSGLEPYGRWIRHPRWGEVWIPANRDRDWRPYTEGRWVYTDEWGWFWDSDEDFGWIAYHYGRWIFDPQFGWLWIPGDEWGPAWVQWRRGDRHAGWAPLPPQQVIYDYDNDPNFWIFVSFNNFTAPNIRRVIVPPQERVVIVRQTVIVNRTIIVERGPRIAVNPGIEPRIVAARVGKPIQVVNVKPVVVVGTAGVQNAVEIRGDQQRQQRVRPQIAEKKETIEPVKDVPPPQALKKGEQGRLGDRPPEAAKGQAATQPATIDPTKGKAKDDAKAKDTAKSAPADTKVEPKSLTKEPSDKGKQPAAVGKGQGPDVKGAPKSEVRRIEPDKGPKSVTPQAEPKQQALPKVEPKQQALPKVEPKQQAVPKVLDQPKQAAPQPKDQPRAAVPAAPPPAAKQVAPAGPPPAAKQAAPAPAQQAAPQQPPAAKGAPAAKGKGEEKGKGG